MGLTPRVGCVGLQRQVYTYLPRSTFQLALLRDPTHPTRKKMDTWLWFPLDRPLLSDWISSRCAEIVGARPFGLHPCKRRPGTVSCRRVAVESRSCWCLQGVMPRRSGWPYFRLGRRVGRSYRCDYKSLEQPSAYRFKWP